MNRRAFLQVSSGTLLALWWNTRATEPRGRTGILRRKAFKKARWYKRRYQRRAPLPRLLRGIYKDMYAGLAARTPLLAQFGKTNQSIRWGGTGVYWDTVISPATGPSTTRDTLWAEPAHSGGPDRPSFFPSWAKA